MCKVTDSVASCGILWPFATSGEAAHTSQVAKRLRLLTAASTAWSQAVCHSAHHPKLLRSAKFQGAGLCAGILEALLVEGEAACLRVNGPSGYALPFLACLDRRCRHAAFHSSTARSTARPLVASVASQISLKLKVCTYFMNFQYVCFSKTVCMSCSG